MGLNGLDIALSGLNIAQRQMDVISTNIANASTPGYTRKILPQEAQSSREQVIGVRPGQLVRSVNMNLARDFWSQVSTVSSADVKVQYLEKIQQFHGAPEQEVSISAELSELRDDFAALSDTPSDTFLMKSALNQAEVIVDKINNFENLISQMRNDTQDDMTQTIDSINARLQEIAEINQDIKVNTISGRSIATLQDRRDVAIEKLSEDIEIDFFTRGDGVMVVQTNNGRELVSENAETVTFSPIRAGPEAAYPSGLSGIYVGDPQEDADATDITTSSIGGKLGGLIELRDEILPEQQAMLDETAYQLARRFDMQGLRLFTDSAGQIPSNAAPDPSTEPPTAVEYVGFSAAIRINQAILDDNTLIQSGTADTALEVQDGSNEVLRRIVEFAFSDTEVQTATGNVDLRTSGNTLQDVIGIYSRNEVKTSLNLTDFADFDEVISAAGGLLDDPNDQFEITFTDPDMEGPPVNATPKTITINLSATSGFTGNNAGEQLMNQINGRLSAAPAIDTAWDASASLNSAGQLVIESRGNIEMDGNITNGAGDDGLNFLGLSSGTFEAEDPYIDIQVGNDPVQRITIGPTDTETDLYDKLHYDGTAGDEGVPGLAVSNDLTDGSGNGFLMIRPGENYDAPVYGGDMRIIGSDFTTSGGVGIVESLFGDALPIETHSYQSETTAGSGEYVTFRTENLGPDANVNTGIVSSSSIIDYAQKMINRQSEEVNVAKTRSDDEGAFRDLLQETLLNETAVNIEEELASLIRIQTAFSAASRVVAAIEEEFREFLNAI